MPIGQFAKFGVIGSFSQEELQFLSNLQRQGLPVSNVYPKLSNFLAESQMQDQFGGESIEDFIEMITSTGFEPDMPANLPSHVGAGDSFFEQATRTPSAGPAGLRPETASFAFQDNFNADGSVRSEMEVVAAQRNRGIGGLMEAISGETNWTNYAGLKAYDVGKGIVQGGMRTALDTMAPGAGIVLSRMFPDTFGKGLIETTLSSTANLIENFLFGKDESELKPGEDEGGFEALKQGRDSIVGGLQALKNATGYTYADDLITAGITAAKRLGGESVSEFQRLVSDVLRLNKVDVTSESERGEQGEAGTGARLFQQDFGKADVINTMANITAFVDNAVELADFEALRTPGGINDPRFDLDSTLEDASAQAADDVANLQSLLINEGLTGADINSIFGLMQGLQGPAVNDQFIQDILESGE